MNKEKKTCHEIFAQRELYTFIDVRSPSEFARGHIPGAHNIALFSDDIRALVGTCYVQQGREPAMHLAMQHVGPNFDQLVKQAQQILNNNNRSLLKLSARMDSTSSPRAEKDAIALKTATAHFDIPSARVGNPTAHPEPVEGCSQLVEGPERLVQKNSVSEEIYFIN